MAARQVHTVVVGPDRSELESPNSTLAEAAALGPTEEGRIPAAPVGHVRKRKKIRSPLSSRCIKWVMFNGRDFSTHDSASWCILRTRTGLHPLDSDESASFGLGRVCSWGTSPGAESMRGPVKKAEYSKSMRVFMLSSPGRGVCILPRSGRGRVCKS